MAAITLTQDQLRALLSYDPQTGVFTRVRAANLQSVRYLEGPVGCTTSGASGGYRAVRVAGKSYRAHRLAWLYMTGEWPEQEIDHRDGDRANNRWDNLRAATRSQNNQNIGLRKSNTSGIKGACWNASRKTWFTQIKANGKYIYLGRFDTKEAAGAAYAAAAARHHGQYARAA